MQVLNHTTAGQLLDVGNTYWDGIYNNGGYREISRVKVINGDSGIVNFAGTLILMM